MKQQRFKQTEIGKAISINPRRELKKGSIAKKVSMDKLSPFKKDITRFEITKYNGGTKFVNEDTLLARITPCLENGKTAYVDFLDKIEVGFGSTEFIILSGKDGETTNEFVYYLAISPKFRDQAISSMTGTSGRQRVQSDFLEIKEIEIPPIQEQHSIAQILSSLDSKIELNNKINKTLEIIGKAIFKKWFIDEAKGEWEEGFLGDGTLTEILSSGIDNFSSEKIYIATADVEGSNIINYNTKITFKERPSRANMQPMHDSIWFAKMKDSKKIFLIDNSKDFEIKNIIFSTGFTGLKVKPEALYYIWNIINSNSFEIEKDNLSIGTTMQGVNNDLIQKIKIAIPDEGSLKNFDHVVKGIYSRIYANNKQNQTLSLIRDALLPKLMSGEIRVK